MTVITVYSVVTKSTVVTKNTVITKGLVATENTVFTKITVVTEKSVLTEYGSNRKHRILGKCNVMYMMHRLESISTYVIIYRALQSYPM